MTTSVEPKPVTIDYGCPDWCERTDHAADLVEPGEHAYHYGPEFGDAVSITGHGSDLYVTLDFKPAGKESNPAKMREMGAHLTLAGEWLEAHQ